MKSPPTLCIYLPLEQRHELAEAADAAGVSLGAFIKMAALRAARRRANRQAVRATRRAAPSTERAA